MTAIKYTLPKDSAELDKLVAKAIKSVQSARVTVQQAAVAVLHHAYQHGDYSAASGLVEGLGNTINGKALVEFFVKFGGLKINADKKGFDGWSGKEFIKEHFNDAKATMWWDLKQQQPYKGFDLEAALQSVLKQHKDAQSKLEGLSEEEKAKVNFKVNDATIQQIFMLCDFKPIIEGQE